MHIQLTLSMFECVTIGSMCITLAPSPPSGLELTFYSGVYGTCIGAMTQFGDDAKSLIGLSGIFIGLGEILGESKSFFIFSAISDHMIHVRFGKQINWLTGRD